MHRFFRASALALALFAANAQAQDDAAAERAFLDSLKYRTGEVAVPAAHASLRLTPGFRYLEQADARRVLEEYWGNPPDESVLGMLVPTADGLGGEHSWAVVLTWSGDGHVGDEDAAEIDYAELLADMKKGTQEANEELKKAGYATVELVGWAQPPRYDAANKRLHWAKELAFEGNEKHTLNYDIRVLGREGYLSMNAVAGIDDLGRVNSGMNEVLGMARFDSGHAYADFDESTDHMAEYGLAALVGGGIAAKSGLFAKLGALLLAGKKFVVLIFVGLAALAKRLFGGRDKTVG